MPRKKQNPIIMISHSADESYLAQAWSDLLVGISNINKSQIWFSSSPTTPIGPDDPFVIAIEKKIKEAQIILCLQTPMSRRKPWIMWEAGMARILPRSLFVIVYQHYDPKPREDIFNQLGTPLDAFQKYRGLEAPNPQIPGAETADLVRAINVLAEKLQGKYTFHINPSPQLANYAALLAPRQAEWKNERTIFEKRMHIGFSPKQCQELLKTDKIPDDVLITWEAKSMEIFDLGDFDREVRWDNFTAHLLKLNMPWPGSAARWGRSLAPWCKRALEGKLVEGPEGLPLYFDARPAHFESYRPSISLRNDRGNTSYFIVSFTLLPRYYTEMPAGSLGILIQHLDFLRMMRWGILEDVEFKEFFRHLKTLAPEQLVAVTAKFARQVADIRTDFWNRGLRPDAIYEAVGSKLEPAVKDVEARYLKAIHQIDPHDRGELPDQLPTAKELQRVYDVLVQTNTEFYLLVLEALEKELKDLPIELESH